MVERVNGGDRLLTDDEYLRDPEILGLVRSRISALRTRLLDFSRRNPLIHLAYRANSTSTLWVVDELPDILRHKLTHGSMRLVALPPLDEDPPDEQAESFQAELAIRRRTDEAYLKAVEALDRTARGAAEAERKIERELRDRLRAHLGLPPRQTKAETSLAQHARIHGIEPSYALPLPDDLHEDGRHDDDDIQTLLLPEKLIRVAKGISEKARGFERETGVNVLHATFGILQWKAPGASDAHSSPLILLECRIERRQSARGIEFHLSGIDGAFFNTTLAEKLAAEHGLSLPPYEGHGVEDYFAAIARMAPKGWTWEVRREVVVGIFPSSRIAMYHDLDPARRPLAENPIVGRLLATVGTDAGGYAPDYETDDKDVAAKVPHLVLDADASQYSALVDVVDGKNLAIQGPPGSGKSQTIVNLIAAALAAGKKVLFIAEKLTALDVVKNRLDAAKLGPFILPLQAGKGTQERVYASLEERVSLGRGSRRHRERFDSSQDALERRRAQLQGYLTALASPFGSSGMTVHEVIGHAIATSEAIVGLPSPVRRLRLGAPETYGRERIEALVTEAQAFAQRLEGLGRMPRLWRDASTSVIGRSDAEDICDEAAAMASSLEAHSAAMQESRLLTFLGPDSWNADLDEVLRVLQRLAASQDTDAAFVESLTDPARRRTVRDLCGQITEKRTTEARLARLLTDPAGWQMADRLEAAQRFAAKAGGRVAPANHQTRIASLESELAQAETCLEAASHVDSLWTSRDTQLTDIRRHAQALLAFPPAIRALRTTDPLRAMRALAQDLSARHSALSQELGEIRRNLPKAGDQDASTVRRHALSIEEAGLFRFLSSDYKAATRFYGELGGNAATDRDTMASRLRGHAAWLERKVEFERDPRLKAMFGTTFQGLATDVAAIMQLVALHDAIEAASRGNPELRALLETSDYAMLEPLAALPDAPDKSLSDLKVRASCLRSDLETERLLLEEARGYLALFRGREEVAEEEVAEACAHLGRITELAGLIDETPAAPLLGERLKGEATKVQDLLAACELAEALAGSADPRLAIALLRAGEAGALCEEALRLSTERAALDRDAADFAQKAGLPASLASGAALFARLKDLRDASMDPSSLLNRGRLSRTERSLRDEGFGLLIDWALDQVLEKGESIHANRFGLLLRGVVAKAMADAAYATHSTALHGYDGRDFDAIRAEIAEKDRELIRMSQDVIHHQLLAEADPPPGRSIGRKSDLTDMALIANELSKKKNRAALRELTRRAGSALLELKPCWMMSPLAVAQYLHKGLQFDLVVIDEASQMTPENAIGSLSRAGQTIVVGDTKQLPPTSFFQTMLAGDSEDENDAEVESESVLDLANVAFMPSRQLRWHYRSRHSGLIRFSNEWMYEGRLTIFPSAQENDPEMGVSLVEVPGLYKAKTNPIEAHAVVEAAVEHMARHPDLSLGICTMNADQKDLILEEFERERDRNPTVQRYVKAWEERNDGIEEFFVKNLETIQGDERDVMFISTLYGPEAPGARVHQRFGPINSIHGHRRLNVLFTRAKRRIVTFTSLKPADIAVGEAKHKGVHMFRAWLEYAKTGHVPQDLRGGEAAESPFELHVASQIEALGFEAVPQVGASGYRIDIGVRHPDWPYGFLLGVECDGATYHSSRSSRERDRLRQEILEGLGWKLYRIWSTDWFQDYHGAREALKAAVHAALAEAKARRPQTEARILPFRPAASVAPSGPAAPPAPTGVPVPGSGYRSSSVAVAAAPRQDDLFGYPLAPAGSALQENDQEDETQEVPEQRQEAEATEAAGLVDENQAVAVQSGPVIGIGSRVKIEALSEGGRKMAFTIVREGHDPEKGRVGVHTPLGQALLDAQEGDEVEYQAGPYIREVRILSVGQPG